MAMTGATMTNFTYTDYLYSISNPKALEAMLNLKRAVDAGEISQYEFSMYVEKFTGYKVAPYYSRYGDVMGYKFVEDVTYTTSSAVNSSSTTLARGTVARPITTAVTQGGKTTISSLAGVGTRVATGAALVGTGVMAVSAGITLGKTIDSVLYNLNPDFWDSHGMSSLNPETWSRITQGDDSLGASLLNVLFDFDPDTGEAQAYIDQNALAYFAAYMQSQGAFSNGAYETSGSITSSVGIPSPVNYIVDSCDIPTTSSQFSGVKYFGHLPLAYDSNGYPIVAYASSPTTIRVCGAYTSVSGVSKPSLQIAWEGSNTSIISNLAKVTPNGYGFSSVSANYYSFYSKYSSEGQCILGSSWVGSNPTFAVPVYTGVTFSNSQSDNNRKILGWVMCYNEATGGQAIDGIGTQSGATTPSLTSSDVDTVLAELQQQFPDLFSNAISYPVLQDDGSVTNYTYVPVAMPDTFTRTGTQPVSGTASQASPTIDPSLQNKIDELTKILTNPYPQTKSDLDNPNPPGNPTDTGDGSSPVPVAPTGSASSLWAIYHPTQAQVDSFGAWLWSADFIDQIKKIFNDPMQSIIGLHKIYATPVDAGTSTIRVGYLDSEVPSAYITQQYVSVDCGSVSLDEQFGNVFDYSPFTDVQIYLPFIGIAPLNVADVMRSTISVEYGVDVLTGACLAMVSVERDLYDSVLYQYSGNCAVQYPISSGSYMGIVAGVISIAGGIAATMATGGGAAPIALGAAGAAMNAHTQVQHSGSFSGNAGAMGGKKPYLIISRPITKVADYFESMQGYKTNSYTTVGECDGYIRAKSVHVINVNATDDELSMINDLLLTGIII